MSATGLFGVGTAPRLVPRAAVAAYDAATTAWWALDVSEARPVIAAIAGGAQIANWVEALLAGVRIADIDENNLHLLGPLGGRERMIGQLFTAYCPPESWQVGAELILAAIADHPRGAPRTLPVTSLAFVDAWAQASTDEAYPDIVFIAVGGTVTDDRSLWAVRASEERYGNLFHHMPSALVQIDTMAVRPIFEEYREQGVTDIIRFLGENPDQVLRVRRSVRVIDANRSALQLFGVDRAEQLIGAIDYMFAASPETNGRVIAAHFEGRRTHVETMKLLTFDGRLRDVELSVTYDTPADRLEVTIFGLVDVTERLRTEAQLRQLQADYSHAARISMLGELATSVAHEVNQPLSAIVTNAETSLRWLSREDPNLAKVDQLTRRIADSARHASDIVQRIRGMAARRAPESMLIDLNRIVEEALLFVQHEMETRSIALSVDLAAGLPAAQGDRVQLQQVVVNLLLNAVQAQGKGADGRIDVRTTATPGNKIALAVHDGGPGITPENLNRIFDSFFTTKDDGVGIGLAICQSIIAAHGGTIAASNHPDGGAVFEIALPAIDTR